MQPVYTISDLKTEEDFSDRHDYDQKSFYLPAVLRLAKYFTIPMTSAFEKKNFGLDTMPEFHRIVCETKRKYSELANVTFYLDSSGYSHAGGKIDPLDTAKMIECFIDYVDCYPDSFDYFFSLDIPVNTKRWHKEFDDYEFLKRMNYKTIQESVRLLNNKKELIDKFYFVKHFKINGQYKIWSDLHNDENISIKQLPINMAIGGSVKARSLKQIKASPVIRLAYSCLFEGYNNDVYHNKTLKLHFLNANEPIDRITNFLIEALFTTYLKEEEVFFTYDTNKNVVQSSEDAANITYFEFQNGKFKVYASPLKLPDKMISTAYFEKEYIDCINQELDRIREGYTPVDINAFSPLNIYSNIQLDHYVEYIVYNDLIHIFEGQKTDKIERDVNTYCDHIKDKEYAHNLQNESLNKFVTILTKNLVAISKFHTWYLHDRSKTSFDQLIQDLF